MRSLVGVLALVVLLYAEDASHMEGEEVGIIHGKQMERYFVETTLPENVGGFDQAFDRLKPFGLLRLANVVTKSEGLEAYGVDAQQKYATALGGAFGFDTASIRGWNIRLAAYVSQKIPILTGDGSRENRELLDEEGGSYAYIGEAGIAYRSASLLVNAGRIRVNTPYADSDDIRMSPNSFEGAHAVLNINDNLQAQGYFLTRWAGVDSGSDQNLFKPLVEDGYGAAGAGAIYASGENMISLWFYAIDKTSNVLYAESSGEHFFTGDFHLEWGLQGAHMQALSDSHVEGDVVGIVLIPEYRSFYFGLAYNHVFAGDGAVITDGFGGGPYYTSLDKQTIGTVSELVPGKDIDVYRLNLGLDLTPLGAKGANLELLHGHFLVQSSAAEVKENDILLTYQITERWYFESIYSNINMMNIDYSDPDNLGFVDLQRLVTRLDYAF